MNPVNVTGTVVVLLAAAVIVGAMIAVIRAVSDDSGRHSELKRFMETLFETPDHLRPGGGERAKQCEGEAGGSEGSAGERFSEPCPACGETVTHEDASCPSCGLRLLS
ncbi:hypothetical protein BG53_01040 [Paenibacillus darwinianus]|uniref:Uncharacterized protein n=1 Tax=Paenibacillus darwinianus TaxID=1380763 RepID=A0A9W5W778_9BACL|nr:hypothetical protein [Paenibacillus darwinianus]EXX88903.1 hypothetical protein BG53_01040 [Paenibacillus darwinianus]EXX89130.1 hypothetical protein BG52_00510 [Paenibacillus darwinianus]EXX90461.1 hypothetical protein CH50_15415 [Paenibacillus darwinianus]